MTRIITILIAILFFINLQAQVYDDYIGAGHMDGVTVFSSSNYQVPGWSETASADKTLSGAGLDGKLIEASRFLAQSTLGANLALIEEVEELGIEPWLDLQFRKQDRFYLDVMKEVYGDVYTFYIQNGGDPNNFACRPSWVNSNYAWWQMVMTNEDYVRQRVALALSEIIVVSKENSDVRDYGYGIASFYDILLRNAFGNFKDILMDVTLHPVMGSYLSHLNNPKSNPAENLFPDENYAREIMQLFTIGLNELNEDGSVKLGPDNFPIPTYDNEDIAELAKVFTGLGAGEISNCGTAFEPSFWLEIRNMDMTVPLVMYDDWHEPGAKVILKDFVIPAGQTGMKDIEDAVDYLFSHPNVGPFIGRLLIQRLVKSNPGPDYISAVTAAFNDNGFGERGDMKAVLKAIYMHPEARDCDEMMDPSHGKLKEPILRYTQFAMALDNFSPYERFWNSGLFILDNAGQHPMHAPTVFNFYLPDFQPNGPISDEDLVAPEFQIHNTRTSIGYINEAYDWSIGEVLLYHFQGPLPYSERIVNTNILDYMEYADIPEVLLNKLDILLTNGQLTPRTRKMIREKINGYNSSSEISRLVNRTKAAMFIMLISPDYNVFR